MPATIETYCIAYEFSTKSTFLELGGFLGDGILKALNVGFKNVISVELSEDLCMFLKKRFVSDKKVMIVQGDVENVLPDIIKDLNEPCAIMLDAHYSGNGTVRGIHDDPIIEELSIIGSSKFKNHVLMIDDMRLLNDEQIRKKVLEINQNYTFMYAEGHVKDDVLICYMK
jgi:hypothetical protein